MPIREFEAFVNDWKDEDKTTAYRNADLRATIMNQHPYRKTAVTAKQLLGEEEDVPVGSDTALRDALKLAGANAKKTKGGDGNG